MVHYALKQTRSSKKQINKKKIIEFEIFMHNKNKLK